MSALEHKFLDLKMAGVTVVSEDGQPVTVTGYLSTFDATPDSYGDLIQQGAYAKTLRDWASRPYAMPMLLEHGQATVGKWVSLSEDARGLLVRGELTPGHSAADDAAASLRHGALSGLSIGFRPAEWTRDHKTGVRTLTGIDLFEGSLVAVPANDTARVLDVRAMSEADADVPAARRSVRACHKVLSAHTAGDPMPAGMKSTLTGYCAKALRALGEDPDGNDSENEGPKALTLREFERRARDHLGLSRREAAALAEHGFPSLQRLWEERAVEVDDPGSPPDPAGAAASHGAIRLLEALRALRLSAPPVPDTPS